MVAEDEKFPTDADKLDRFERVADNADDRRRARNAARPRAALLRVHARGRRERSREYMGVYRAEPNETIIHEGDVGDFMLLIVRGEVDILKRGCSASSST